MLKHDTQEIVPETAHCADECQTDKIYCANCIHCKLVKSPAGIPGQFLLRVRCSAGKWQKKTGEEKLYKFFTISRRSIEYCDEYEEMGEPEAFLRDLRKQLPGKDEPYDDWSENGFYY